MHHNRRRMLIAIAGQHRGPARRDAPTDTPADGTAGGGTGTTPPADAGNGGKPADADPAKVTIAGDFDPDRAARAIASAREAEKTAKAEAKAANDQLAKVMAALGKNPDGTDLADPEAHAAQLTQRAEAAEAAAWRAGVQLQVHNAAAEHGASATRLLDSMGFIDTLDDLVDVDPNSADFRTALADRVKAWVEKHPEFKASGGQGPGRMGAEHTGGNAGGQRVQGLGAAVTAAYNKR